MLKKNLTKLIICFLLSGITNYSNAGKATATEVEIAAIHPGTDDKIGAMLLQSVNLIGIPYKWGGNNPTSGLDCSGFIRYVFKQSLGITLPRTANEMARLGRSIPRDELEPGDLVFFNLNGGHRISHIGMYLGHNQFIQSPRAGKDIQVTEMSQYYQSRFIVAKRMVQEDVNDNGQTVLSDLRSEQDSFSTKAIKPKKKKRPSLPRTTK